jgi:hypothetical protein
MYEFGLSFIGQKSTRDDDHLEGPHILIALIYIMCNRNE